MVSTKTISKISIKEGGVGITYKETFVQDENVFHVSHEVTSPMAPKKAFFDNFQRLKKFALAEFDLDAKDEKKKERCVVNHLHIYRKDEGTQIKISVTLYNQKNGSWSATTPLISLEDPDYMKAVSIADSVEEVVFNAEKYLEGENGELVLEFEGEADAEPVAGTIDPTMPKSEDA